MNNEEQPNNRDEMRFQIGADIKKALGNTDWDKIPVNFLRTRENYPTELKDITKVDGLTGLPAISHKDEYNLWFDEKIADSLRKGKGVALLTMDMNQLKQLNDSVGRDHGDALIKWGAAKTGRELNEKLGKFQDSGAEIYMFRLGEKGDELQIVVTNIDVDGAEDVNNFNSALTELRSSVIDKFTYQPSDAVARGKGIPTISFSSSIGIATTFDTIVAAKVNDELNLNLPANKRTKFSSAWAESPKNVARILNRLADNRAASLKLQGDLQRISESLLSHNDDIDKFIQEVSTFYGDSRIDSIVLTALSNFSAAKIVEDIDAMENRGIAENTKLSKIVNEGKKAITKLKKHIGAIFGKAEKDPKRIKKLDKDVAWFTGKVKDSGGANWDNVSQKLVYKNNPLFKDNDGGDDKTGLLYYSPEVRTRVIEKIGQAIAMGKHVVIASVDADQLKKANNISWNLGDAFIIRNAAVVSEKVEPLITDGIELSVLSRDAAGDEILIFGVMDDAESAEAVKTAINGLNTWREDVDLEDGKKFTLSTSSWAVTDGDFQEATKDTSSWLLEGKRDKPFTYFNKLLKSADDNLKILKSSKQIENLPIKEFIDSQNVATAIDMINDDLGGGRMSERSLNIVLSVVAVKSAFEYCYLNNLPKENAWKIFDHLFKETKFADSPEEVRNSYLVLLQDLQNSIVEKFGQRA